MEKIFLYNQDFLFPSKVKTWVKKMSGRPPGGPARVFESLALGLKEQDVNFFINQKPKAGESGVACVLSDEKVLAWVLKNKNLFTKIIAGPNIVITPNDFNGLVRNRDINTYVVPSEWTRNWWMTMAPEMQAKLKLWAAGVEDWGQLQKPDGQCLVFKKEVEDEVVDLVIDKLKSANLNYKLISYGSYDFNSYRKLLSESRFMIYLTQHESQGLALQEAWMAGIPTLVLNGQAFNYRGFSWQDPKISAPLMSPECGRFFTDKNDFEIELKKFLQDFNQFHPREYSLQHFTNKVSAENYLKLINES